MTDKLDILARLDAMSDDEFLNELTEASDYGLTALLGTPSDYITSNHKPLIYCEDFPRLLQKFLITDSNTSNSTKKYNQDSKYQDTPSLWGRFPFGTSCQDSQLMCA
jgi:hypothetical protein